MRTFARRVRKHQKNHAAMPLAVSVSSSVVLEAIEALATRVRWYERRGYTTPPQTLAALRSLCAAVGLDASRVGAP
jgi:hypothetical protein